MATTDGQTSNAKIETSGDSDGPYRTGTPPTLEALQEGVRLTLAPHKVPRRQVFLDELPLLAERQRGQEAAAPGVVRSFVEAIAATGSS
ncbi:hypothetical protein GGC64_006162 [Mycobacterium sp. OAS707]|nr:hypothetical protein [Mycobacterium sp. OAS707]